MTTTLPPGTDGPVTAAAVLAGAREQVSGLADEFWAAKPAEVLLAANAEIERLRSTLASVQAQVAVEIEATGAAKCDGWGSTADYLTRVAGGRQGCGRRLLRTGQALTGDRELTWTALHAGDLSPEHAEVIVSTLDLLPVDRELRRVAEIYLIEHAASLNATELARLGSAVLEVLDPEGVAAREEKRLDRHERSAHLNRFLSLVEDGLGGVRLKGRGTVEDAAVIKAALAALSAPLPATDPECGTDGRDPRDHGARTWDALVEACQRLEDAQVLPESHGMKPRIIVTSNFDDLRNGLGTATLDTGDTLSGAAVRRLACDADLLPMVLGTDGQVLDVGQTQRLVTMGIWLALIARDKHCAFPGCRRPPVACDAHHIVHWAHGGPTALHNLVLLCRAHHTVVHHTGWQVRLNPDDGLPEFKPPPGRHRLTPEFRATLDETGDDWIRERRPRDEYST